MDKKQVRIIFNIKGEFPAQIKNEFEEACRLNGQDMTEALNQLIRDYIRKLKIK